MRPGDIFDLENVRRLLLKKIGNPQSLKMLTVMTFADIQGRSNPEAAIPHGRPENLVASFYMSPPTSWDRSVDRRVRTTLPIGDPTLLQNRLRFPWFPPRSTDELKAIPEGLASSATCKPPPRQIRKSTFLMALPTWNSGTMFSFGPAPQPASFFRPQP